MNKLFLNECLIYSKNTGEFFWKKRPLHHFKNSHGMNIWNSRYPNTRAGTQYTPSNLSDYFRRKIVISGKNIMEHQAAWIISFGEIPNGLYIDHINGNSLDNKLSNLRLVTHSENHKNRKIQSNNTSGVQGVRFIKNKWNARIKIQGKEKSLGVFINKEDAINARVNYAKKNGFSERHSVRGYGTDIVRKLDA